MLKRLISTMAQGPMHRKTPLEELLDALPPADLQIEQLRACTQYELLHTLSHSIWHTFGLFKYVEKLLSYENSQPVALEILHNILLLHSWIKTFVLDSKNGPIDLKNALGAEYITKEHEIIYAIRGEFDAEQDGEDLLACFRLVFNRYGPKHYITRYRWCLGECPSADLTRLWLRALPGNYHHAAICERNRKI